MCQPVLLKLLAVFQALIVREMRARIQTKASRLLRRHNIAAVVVSSDVWNSLEFQ